MSFKRTRSAATAAKNAPAATALLAVVIILVSGACGGTPSEEALVVYSGRSKSLIAPVVDRFQDKTGIKVNVRYGDTAQLAVALVEEGRASRADLFWAQDAGALGAVAAAGLFRALPDSLLAPVATSYRSRQGTWVATSGRARSLAYATERVRAVDLPSSLFALTDARWEGRIGWAPMNGSFQAAVTAMRLTTNDSTTSAWLHAMKANGTKSYPKNTAILQAIANGEIDLGLVNHYYLYQFKSQDPDFPVAQAYFGANDPGNLVNVAGVGVLASSESAEDAMRFVQFLLSPSTQRHFKEATFEYPATTAAMDSSRVPPGLPALDLSALRDLQGTLALLREVELL